MSGSVSEALLACVGAAALVRSAWLLVGLARVIPVHRAARVRRWGPAELLTFLELPAFLALTAWLLFRPPAATLASSLALPAAALGALLAVGRASRSRSGRSPPACAAGSSSMRVTS